MEKKKFAKETGNKIVLNVEEVQLKLKMLVQDTVFKNAPKEQAEAKAKKIIKQFSSSITHPYEKIKFEKGFLNSYLKWYAFFLIGNIAFRKFQQKQWEKLLQEEKQKPVEKKKVDKYFKVKIELSSPPPLEPWETSKAEVERGATSITSYQKKVKSAYTRLIAGLSKQQAKEISGGSLRNAAEANVRWSHNMAVVRSMKDNGVRLAWTSSHVDCSKRCEQWQGRLYSLDGTSGTKDGTTYIPLTEAMKGTVKYGIGNGILSGYNCRHKLLAYAKGLKPGREYTTEEMNKARAINNNQRRMESSIRQSKEVGHLALKYDRKVAIEEFDKARAKTEKYIRFCNQSSVKPQLERTEVMREETEFKNTLHMDDFNDIIETEVSGGSRVSSVWKHAKARMIQREISNEYIKDALSSPDIMTPVKYDDLGRPSMQYVKDRNLIYYNPVDNVITSVRRAKVKEVEKLRRLYDKYDTNKF